MEAFTRGQLFECVSSQSTALALLRAGDLRLVWWNKAFAKTLLPKGLLSRKGTQELSLTDLFFEVQSAAVRELAAIAAKVGGAFDQERLMLRGNGTHFSAEVRLHACGAESTEAEAGEALLALEVHDLTKTLSLERQATSAQRLQSIIAASPLHVFAIDAGHRFTSDCSRNASRLAGVNILKGMVFSEVFAPPRFHFRGASAEDVWCTITAAFVLPPDQAEGLLSSTAENLTVLAQDEEGSREFRVSLHGLVDQASLGGVALCLVPLS